MKEIFKKGFSFGLTSGTITTLGLIIGLHSGCASAFGLGDLCKFIVGVDYDWLV